MKISMKNVLKRLLPALSAAVFACALALGLCACNKPSSSDTLIVGTSMTVDTLNRLDADGGAPGYAYDKIASALTQMPIVYATGGEYASLVCDIKTYEDGALWEFALKDGFVWQDGVSVTANDLKFTLEAKLKDSDLQSVTLNGGLVQVRLSSPKVKFLDALNGVTLMPKHIFEGASKHTLTDAQSVIGCGPFKFARYDKAAGTLEFEKYSQYPYADKVAFNRVIVKMFNSSDTLKLALKAHDVDMIWSYSTGLDANAVADFENQSDIALVSYSSKRIPKALFFNNQRLTDVNVKKAIRKALDYGKIRRIFGTTAAALPREGFVSPDVFGYSESAELVRDLEGAKRLLAESGYSQTNKFRLELLVRADGDDSQYASLIKTDLEETGMIEVVLDVRGSDWQSRYQSGLHMASLATVTAAGYDFEAGYATRYMLPYRSSAMASLNPVCHANIAVDAQDGGLTEFGKIRNALEGAKSVEELRAAVMAYEKYFEDNAPAIALLYDSVVQAHGRRLEGVAVDGLYGILNTQGFLTMKKLA